MTTEQQFFQNIVHSNAITYQALENTIGDMNKNIGLSANFFELASKVVGSTITENYDLASLFGNYSDQINSNNTDFLQQSLQNVVPGIANTVAYPNYSVCTHISTSLDNYNIGNSYLSADKDLNKKKDLFILTHSIFFSLLILPTYNKLYLNEER